MIWVDSREPKKYLEFLLKTFPGTKFEVTALREGDYMSERVLVERKTVADLRSSILGTKDKSGRFIKQLERMATHDDQVVVVMVTGNMEKYVTDMRKIGISVDQEILYGELASCSCRYGVQTWWFENEWDGMVTMVKYMKKVEEGKLRVPSRRDPDILSARLLGVTLYQWEDLKKRFRSITSIALADEKDIMKVKGIGDKKAKKIKRVLMGLEDDI